MTAPMRRRLLNREIAIEARRIAHAATLTCCNRRNAEYSGSDYDDEHTRRCNELKRQIETLAIEVKLASLQPPAKQQPGPPREDEQTDRHGGCV
jgi:hypothetical protein